MIIKDCRYVLPGCAQKQTARLPLRDPAPVRSGLRHYVAVLITAVVQAGRQEGRHINQLQRDQGALTTTDRLMLEKVRNATFACSVI